MRACVIHSQDVDSVDAVAELIAGAKVALGASLPRVAMLFAGIDHDFTVVLEHINAQWPGSRSSVALPMVRCHRTSSLPKIRSLLSCFRAMTVRRYPVSP